jgi:hypothetical protein
VTYPELRSLGVVLLLGIEALVNEGEGAGSASTELGLHTKDCNALFLDLQNLREFLFDLGLCQGAHVRVNDLNGLQAIEQEVYLQLGFWPRGGFFGIYGRKG